MYKTIWIIIEDNISTELTYYHFGKNPQFPSWYFGESSYSVEYIWNFKLVFTIETFLKCLMHHYIIR